MAIINVQNWTIDQVVDWITGLSPSLSQYAEIFSSKAISGQKLLTLMQGDLDYLLGITRIGDQLLLYDAIQSLRDELQTPWITLQSLALALSVRCKNYRSELTQQKQKAESEALLQFHFQQQSQQNHHYHQSSQQFDDHHYHLLTPKFSNLKSSNHHHHHHYHSSATLSSSNSSSGSSSLSSSHHNQTSSSSSNLSHSSNTCTPNLTNAVSTLSISNSSGIGSGSSSSSRLETIPTASLASASYLLDAGKVLIRWLTRFPFQGKLDYDEISRKLSKHCFELAVLSQRDTFADNAIEEVQYLCTKIIELCEALIHSKDSLVIQPAGVDVITLRKRNEQDWGLQFESSYWGLHQITGVKLSSPAQQSGHLERGDEILQVNYQTVLAWPQASVISLLHECENEVILTVKRRPRHASTNLYLGGNHVYLNKVPNRKSFFERKAKELENRVVVGVSTVPTTAVVGTGGPGGKASLTSNVVAGNSSETVSVNNSKLAQLAVGFTIDEVIEDKKGSKKNGEDSHNEERRKDGDKKEEAGRRSDDMSNSINYKRDDEKASARFWKLYPKPKYLIKRRATVTGASPTETRPPVTFVNDDPPTINGGNQQQRFAKENCNDVSSSNNGTVNHHQQVHHRRSTPVTTTTANKNVDADRDGVGGGKMQLLNPSMLIQRPPLDKARSAPEREMSVSGGGETTGQNNEVVEQKTNANVQQEKEKTEKQEIDKGKIEKEKIEKGKIEKEKIEKGKIEKEKIEKGKIEKEKIQTGKIEKEKIQTGKIEKEKIQTGKIEEERIEKGKIETGKIEEENIEKRKIEKKDKSNIARKHVDETKKEEKKGSQVPVVDEDEVFKVLDHSKCVQKNDNNHGIVPSAVHAHPPNPITAPPPKPKPRLSKSSIGSLKKQDNFEELAAPTASADSLPRNVTVNICATTATRSYKETVYKEPEPLAILHKGFLHIRSQLRKQSSSNSASALPHIAALNSAGSPATSSPLLVSSSSPRWIRQSALFYNNWDFEIINPVAAASSCAIAGSSGTSGCTSGSFRSSGTSLSNKKDDVQKQQQNFKVKITKSQTEEGLVRKEEFTVMPASEVHSRPFAFKITSGDAVTYYLAAESQLELDAWICVMTTGKLPLNHEIRTLGSANSSAPTKSRNNSSSVGGDIARRNFSSARAPYKRSVSLGSSQSPNISSSNLSSSPSTASHHYPHHHSYHHPACQQPLHASATPPPSTNYPHHTPGTTTYSPLARSINNLTRPYYSSSTNLSTVKTPNPYVSGSPNSTTYLNRAKSASLKTDWFLRGNAAAGHHPSNISSITITSKKIGGSGKSSHQHPVSTQYPTPTGTPTKQHHQNNGTQQPMMGVTMYKNKMGSGNGNGEDCNTSPTRKYRCPNCSYVVKVDKETQTFLEKKNQGKGEEEEGTGDNTGAKDQGTSTGGGGEIKLVFFDNGGESRV